MSNIDFRVSNGKDDFNVNDEGFFARHIKLISLIICLIIITVGAVIIVSRVLSSNKLKQNSRIYEFYESYYEINADSSDNDIQNALVKLSEGETSFSSNKDVIARTNFYKADLYDRLSDTANKIACLEKVVQSARKNNYLLSISMYNLAVTYEENSNMEKAIEYYEMIYNTFKTDSEFSDISLFSLYRLCSRLDIEKANKYKSILENEFKDSEYTKFLLNFNR